MPEIKGFENLLVHVKDPLSPYVLKTENGCIMENVWQFSKIYKMVFEQKQTLHRWTKEEGWCHPAETHIDEKGNITPQYWLWRNKGFNFQHPVRYPNGYHGRTKCVGVVVRRDLLTNIPDPEITRKVTVIDGRVDYVLVPPEYFYVTRRCVYYNVYVTLARRIDQFHQLQRNIFSGTKYQTVEVDGPRKAEDYPFNLADDNSLLLARDTARGWLNNRSQSFGHGVCLAIALINKDEWINI